MENFKDSSQSAWDSEVCVFNHHKISPLHVFGLARVTELAVEPVRGQVKLLACRAGSRAVPFGAWLVASMVRVFSGENMGALVWIPELPT